MIACRPLTIQTRSEERIARHRLTLAEKAPSVDDGAFLNESDRNLFARLLREPAEYVDHPVFHERNAESRLFSGPASLIGDEARFAEEPLSRRKASELLTPSEETLLFQRLNYARMRWQGILRSSRVQRIPMAGLRLLLAWARRESEARRCIVEANMRLVPQMIKQVRMTGRDIDEWVSDGNFTLLRCVSKFDCSRGFRFSTYACRAILQGFVRVGVKTRRYRSRFPLDLTVEPGEFLVQTHEEARAGCLEEIRRILNENRAQLSEQERLVLHSRFMLGRTSPHTEAQTLEQMGHLMGLSKERVRQIQNRGLRKLRVTLEDSLARDLAPPRNAYRG